ncbi:GNAT family N-acetyltransferase [Paenibacillus sp. FSL H8-0034]|uniref:GNAT family N-acetyltransferase n=1 Tax=Paenibacillus sp. FSL H8-0034 TaxID=2954671 RepID=UPI0030F6200C
MFQYRDVRHEDFKIIATFPQNQEDLFYMFPKGIYPITPEQLEEVALIRFSPTVILYQDQVVGYCNFYKADEGKDCWLGNVIVNPEYRKIGIGTYLIQIMKNKAINHYKAQELKLVCHNTNTMALLFYYKQGFKPFDMNLVEDYKGDQIIRIIMTIKLCE